MSKKTRARRGAPSGPVYQRRGAPVRANSPLPNTRPSPRAREHWIKNRWLRWFLTLALTVGYAALMWYVVFPWVDSTFVNQPAL